MGEIKKYRENMKKSINLMHQLSTLNTQQIQIMEALKANLKDISNVPFLSPEEQEELNKEFKEMIECMSLHQSLSEGCAQVYSATSLELFKMYRQLEIVETIEKLEEYPYD